VRTKTFVRLLDFTIELSVKPTSFFDVHAQHLQELLSRSQQFHRTAGRELIVNSINSIVERVKATDKRSSLGGQPATLRSQEHAVSARLLFQNSPSSVVAKHMLMPDRILATLVIHGMRRRPKL